MLDVFMLVWLSNIACVGKVCWVGDWLSAYGISDDSAFLLLTTTPVLVTSLPI